MPEIEISDEQRAYLDDLVAELSEDHVGEYGAVRYRDAIQFLIDHYQAAGDGSPPGQAASDPDGDQEGTDTGMPSDADRLDAMMSLLETHDDKWDEGGGEDGNYTVTLPDGGSETVRTRDDVRALLFKHYG